jgi:aminotransferase in exopolysaccharide biosynthesis
MNNPENFVAQFVSAVRSVVGSNPVSLHEPSFNGNEWLYVKECLDSTYVSSIGPFVNRFEDQLAKFTGSKYAIAVVNGTAALHIALKLAGVQRGDEVLVPALTFIATANAVSYCNASPHFVDSELVTLGMDPHKLREYLNEHTEQRFGQCINLANGKVIRAMVPMHTFGHPADIENLMRVSHDFKIIIVEDAAESLGSFYQGRHTGTFGSMGVVSFNGNKIITSGGGGAILTNNQELAHHARHLTTTAKMSHPWEFRHNEVGYNYRMPNLNAALGCAQLEQLLVKVNAKRMLFERYKTAFEKLKLVTLISEPENCKSNYWLQTLSLNDDSEKELDTLLIAMNNAGYMARPVWDLISELDPYKNCQSMELTTAKLLRRRLINIPSSPTLV